MHNISISPVTRANGVGSVTVLMDKGRVVKAKSEGTIFRGFEMILEGRNPFDAPYFTQRICGICSSFHALASCHALEAIGEVTLPHNGVITRNMIVGLDLLQNHIRHFYLLLLWDWVSPPPMAPFKGGYTTDFRFSPEVTEKLREHYWQGIEYARFSHETVTLLGGKIPHNHGIIPGGVSLMPNGALLLELKERIKKLEDFCREVYLPDALLIKDTYSDYLNLGICSSRHLSFGLFTSPFEDDCFYPTGTKSENVPNEQKEPLDISLIAEGHNYSWFAGGEEDHPYNQKTKPDMSNKEAYSWIKGPRYGGEPCSGGVLSRMIIKNPTLREKNSVINRIVARAKEALDVATYLGDLTEKLIPDEPAYLPFKLPPSGRGVGITDAMRGPLSHWVTLKKGRIHRYQIITPSAWNFSPRDHLEQPGPAEDALMGTLVENPKEPIEISRIIRSFDPCYSCAAHVIDMEKNNKVIIEQP